MVKKFLTWTGWLGVIPLLFWFAVAIVVGIPWKHNVSTLDGRVVDILVAKWGEPQIKIARNDFSGVWIGRHDDGTYWSMGYLPAGRYCALTYLSYPVPWRPEYKLLLEQYYRPRT